MMQPSGPDLRRTLADKLVGEGFATPVEAAEFLRVSRSKIYDMMNGKILASAKFGGSRRIPWSVLREYAAGCMT